MLTRRHFLIFLALTAVLALAVWGGREVRSMANYTAADGPLFEGHDGPSPPEFDGTLKVITWNIRFGEAVETAVAELQTNPSLQNADVLLLQEMDEQGVAAIAEELGYHYVYFPASIHSHHKRNFGNAVLSKWPISAAHKLLLPHENPSNAQWRIAARATATIAGQTLLLYSVHTETLWLPPGKRAAQAQAIADDILAQPAVDFVIVGGDFNTITAADVAALENVLAQAGQERVSDRAGASMSVWGFEAAADHLFARGFTPVDNGVYAETAASDHYPVWAELSVTD